MYKRSNNLLVNCEIIETQQWLKELQEKNIQDFQINLFRVWCMDISNDLSLMAIGGISQNHTIFIYNQPYMTLCNQIQATSHQVYLLQFSQRDKYLCAGCYGQQVLLWDVDDVKQIQNVQYKMVIKTEFGVIARIVFFNNERQLCFQGLSHLFIINLETNNQAKIIKINHKPSSFDINQSKLYEVGKSSIIYIRDIFREKFQDLYVVANLSLLKLLYQEKPFYSCIQLAEFILFQYNKWKAYSKKQNKRKSFIDKAVLGQQIIDIFSIQPSEQFDNIYFVNLETGQLLLIYTTQISQPSFIYKMMPKIYFRQNQFN